MRDCVLVVRMGSVVRTAQFGVLVPTGYLKF